MDSAGMMVAGGWAARMSEPLMGRCGMRSVSNGDDESFRMVGCLALEEGGTVSTAHGWWRDAARLSSTLPWGAGC